MFKKLSRGFVLFSVISSISAWAGKTASWQNAYLSERCRQVPDIILKIKTKIDRISLIQEKLAEARALLDPLPQAQLESQISALIRGFNDHWSKHQKIRTEMLSFYDQLGKACEDWIVYFPDQLENLFRETGEKVLMRVREGEGLKNRFLEDLDKNRTTLKSNTFPFLLREVHFHYQNWDHHQNEYEKGLSEWKDYRQREALKSLKTAEYYNKQFQNKVKDLAGR